MLIVWRLTTARFARSAFSGDGARLYGGRWHRKGVPLVYTASSQSLAMLEDFIGKPVSMQAESSYTQEQFDIVLM